jgi:hypothetical protein
MSVRVMTGHTDDDAEALDGADPVEGPDGGLPPALAFDASPVTGVVGIPGRPGGRGRGPLLLAIACMFGIFFFKHATSA